MSFFELIDRRYSVREYSGQPVEKEKLLRILEAARLAPSAVNYQPRHFIVVTDDELKGKIAAAYSREWFKEAPVVIVCCGDHRQAWKRRDGKNHCDVDVAIAVDHLTLAATSLGLGSCWVCAFDEDKVREVLDLPEYLEPIVLIPLGYPAEEQVPTKERKDLEELVSWNKYQL